MRPPRVLLADDHRGVAEALRNFVPKAFELVGTVGDGGALLDAAMTLRPDVVVAAIAMPVVDGLTAMKQIHQRLPYTKVILITSYGDASLARHALNAGASGLIMKVHAPIELVDAILRVANGETFVSGAIAL